MEAFERIDADFENNARIGCSEDRLNRRGFPDSAVHGKIVVAMFLRNAERRKNGKTHLYWSVVENRRFDSGRVVQCHALYRGEIHSSQTEAWGRAIEVFDADEGRSRSLALLPEYTTVRSASNA